MEGDRIVRAGAFKPWAPLVFLGTEVSGKTLGIIGLGEIGKAVARRAQGFGMTIIYHNRHRMSETEERVLGVTYSELATLLAQADFVSLHVPFTEQTKHLIGPNELELMKPSAYLINAFRGPIVDEGALVDALREKKIAGAGLDVYEREPELTPGLSDMENVVLTPHVGSATIETRTKMAQLAAKNLREGLAGRLPPNCLNCSR